MINWFTFRLAIRLWRCTQLELESYLRLQQLGPADPAGPAGKFLFKRSIFQKFWKAYCCTKSLFLELETSNFVCLLIFLIFLNYAKFQKDWTTFILDIQGHPGQSVPTFNQYLNKFWWIWILLWLSACCQHDSNLLMTLGFG